MNVGVAMRISNMLTPWNILLFNNWQSVCKDLNSFIRFHLLSKTEMEWKETIQTVSNSTYLIDYASNLIQSVNQAMSLNYISTQQRIIITIIKKKLLGSVKRHYSTYALNWSSKIHWFHQSTEQSLFSNSLSNVLHGRKHRNDGSMIKSNFTRPLWAQLLDIHCLCCLFDIRFPKEISSMQKYFSSSMP